MRAQHSLLPRSNHGFQKISAIFCGKKRQNNSRLHMIEAWKRLFMVVVPFIYLIGRLFALLNVFQERIFDILIQIFRNLQNFPQSWITKIPTFFMSVRHTTLNLVKLSCNKNMISELVSDFFVFGLYNNWYSKLCNVRRETG